MKKPMVITVNGVDYFGIPNENFSEINECLRVGNRNEDGLAEYIMNANIHNTDTYRLAAGSSLMCRELDQRESLIWDTLMVKFTNIQSTAMDRVINMLFKEII